VIDRLILDMAMVFIIGVGIGLACGIGSVMFILINTKKD